MYLKLLFVDDEPRVLRGLKRMIIDSDNAWECTFVDSGEKALEELENNQFDFIISDMRMPYMNGIQLLSEVKARHPETIRIILSGSSDWDYVINSVGLAHQYISKPVNYDNLQTAIVRANKLKQLLKNDRIKTVVSGLNTLPSLPQIFLDIQEELRSSDSSLKRIGEIISKDIGMSAKTLQLVNSAFFGLGKAVSCPIQATTLLGLETIKALALTLHIFEKVDQERIPAFDFDELWNHSLLVGRIARRLARLHDFSKEDMENTMIAGLLHDTGKLILATSLPDLYGKALSISETDNINLVDAEQELFGSTHAEIGAYLFGLWGLPAPIVEAVAFHHKPSSCAGTKFDTLAAVHIANALDHEAKCINSPATSGYFDIEYVAKFELNDKYPEWREIGQKLIAQGNNNV